jgi:DNA transformation protein
LYLHSKSAIFDFTSIRIPMAVDLEVLAYIEQQLVAFPGWKSKKMFGGVGFFRDDVMFGVIKYGRLMLRTDPEDLGLYVNEPQFAVEMQGQLKTMPYHAVPEAVVSNPQQLAVWAQTAFELTLASKSRRKSPSR